MDVNAGGVSLFEVQGWTGYSSVDGHARSGISGDVDLLLYAFTSECNVKFFSSVT